MYSSITALKDAINAAIDKGKFPFEKAKYAELFNVPTGKFEIVLTGRGDEKILIPAEDNYSLLYRGQHCDYPTLLPTLYRKNLSSVEMLVHRMRYMMFRELVSSHPIVKKYFIPNNYYVDYLGLAQHYGLSTKVLDFTSSIDIAIFFAICPYNNSDDSYHPVQDEGDYIGYIHLLQPFLSSNFANNEIAMFDKPLYPIGLQPFYRPAVQRGFGYHCKEGNQPATQKVSFKYSRKDSEYYYNMYQRGRELWINDPLVDKTKAIKVQNAFTPSILRRTISEFNVHQEKVSSIRKMLYDSGYMITNNSPHQSFSQAEIANIESRWNTKDKDDFETKLVHRKRMDTNGHLISPYMDLRSISMTEMLRVVSCGGFAIPEGDTTK